MDTVKILKKIVLYIILLFSISSEINATHMVGGDFTYRSLGNGFFEITLTIRRDCEFGADDAFFDKRAVIAVFEPNGSLVKGVGDRGGFFLNYIGNDTLNESLNVKCGVLGAPVCVHESIYRDTIFLPQPKAGGKYILVYQRCCRNQTLLNITDPLLTGGSYILEIDEYAFNQRNNSPRFKKWPDIYICANQSLNFDHGAYESDGDSLIYRLYTPSSGATIEFPFPTIENPARYTPVYNTVNWAPGYSLANVLGGTDPLIIDSKTGLITGTPNKVGQFLVGVMVEEYRNGKLISVIRRDFEYNVRPCVDPPDARFTSVDVICGSRTTDTLKLTNTSLFSETYKWEIYVHSTKQTLKFTSKDVNFIYTLPLGGKDTFDIQLEAYHSVPNCSDFYTKTVIAIGYPLIVDFDYKIIECLEDKLILNLKDKFSQLNDLYTFKNNKWTIKFGNSEIFLSGNDVNVEIPKKNEFTITLEVFTEENCNNSVTKNISYNFPDIQFIAEPVIVCKGSSVKIVKNPNSAWTYIWSPETGLTFNGNDKSNPTFIGDNNRKYYVTITDGLCYHYDTIEVKVKDYFSIKIEGPDTVCTDQVQLKGVGVPVGETDAVLQWSKNRSFSSIFGEGQTTVTVDVTEKVNKYYLRIKPGTGCSNNIDSITIYNGSFKLEFDKEISYCNKNLVKIELTNKTPGINVTYTWTDPSGIIVGPKNGSAVTIYTDKVGEFLLIFKAVSELGCEYIDTIKVISSPGNTISIKEDLTCGTYQMCFSVEGGTVTSYKWQITNANGQIINFTTSNPCYDFKQPGKFKVYVEVEVQGCDGIIIVERAIEVPDLLKVETEFKEVTYCKNATIELKAKSNIESTIYWYNGEGKQIGVGEKITYSPKGNEKIKVVAIDNYDCKDSLYIELKKYIFDLKYIDPGVVCKGDTVVMEIKNNTSSELNYEWSGTGLISGINSNKATAKVNNSTSFNVKISDKLLGCDTSITVNVTVSDIDISINAEAKEVVINNEIFVEVLNVPAGSTISWSTGEKNVTRIQYAPKSTTNNVFKEPVTICVTVTDQYGCVDSACVIIVVIDPPCNEEDIYFPNAFSPNNDGENDTFRPRGKYIRNVSMEIYDRWGELLFKHDKGDDKLSWNGTHNGKDLTPDTYTYKIFVQCQDNDDYSKVSNVSLLK